MSKMLPKNVLNAIFTDKWAIETNHLDVLIDIASRTHSDMDAVLATPTERRESGSVRVRDGVAIINAFGPIFPRADIFTDISGATSVETLALLFGEALNAPDVNAIVLNIDSPGGNVVGVNEFSNLVYESRGKKPIIAYTGGLCASAAYWIASAADKIIADKTAFIGSIGVVAAWTDDSKAREKEGLVDYEVVSSQSPDKRQNPNSKEGRAKLQAELDSLADIFISSIARNRNTNNAFISENYGKGGVLITDEAIKVGMVDEIGSLENIITDLYQFNPINKGVTTMSIQGMAMSRQNTRISDPAILSSLPDIEVFGPGMKIVSEEFAASKKEDDEEKKKADTTEDEEDEEEKEDAKKSSSNKQMAALLSTNPTLYNAIKQIGAAEERERIRAIDEIGADMGYSNLVKSAKYDKPITAAELALQIVKADKASITKAATDYMADAEDVSDIPASTGDNTNTDNENNAIVKAMVSGFKAAGGKEVKHVG